MMQMLTDPASRPRWAAPPREPAAEKLLADALGLPSLLCASLIARGIRTPEDAERFLNPRLEHLHDPMLLPDAHAAIREIMLAKERGETVYVHGDYDVDGVTSAAIWTRSLRKLGFNVVPHVPHRMKEGYGIHESAVKEAKERGAQLFLTCDCGTSALETIAMAREAGMRVVVTDHHELGTHTPEAHALVNPRRPDSAYPFPHLCGAGVAFKIAQAVAESCGATKAQFERAFLDLVCLGTIADVVPLTGENRILAWHGLKHVAATQKKGLQALMSVADIDPNKGVSAFDVGWKLGPRLNAAGRVDDAAHALRLLLTEDDKEAAEAAKLLNDHNLARRDEEARILAEAEEIVLQGGLNAKALILVFAEGWHPGVIGIVAGRLADRYHRPTLVASVDGQNGTARGSARSIAAFHLHDALSANRDLFITCGGHARAAGFTILSERLAEAAERLVEYAGAILRPEDLVPTLEADADVSSAELTAAAFLALEKLEPCGEANRRPRFILRGTKLALIQPTSKPEHVRFAIHGPPKVFGIAFDSAQLFEALQQGDLADLMFEPMVDRWNGETRPRLELKALEKQGLTPPGV